ncbi:MAG TPA: hypothetical protein VNT79_18880 [Phycisphaerae bacterium]|nr:hypothetical protein [Phycisphaerae bacterium]
MNVGISADNEQFIATSLGSGRYTDSAALLNEAIALLKRRDEIIRAVDAGVDQLDQGDVVDGDHVFNRLAEKHGPESKSSSD